MKICFFILVVCSFGLTARVFATEQAGLELIASCTRDEDGRTRDPKAQSEGAFRYNFTISLKNVGAVPLAVLKNERGVGSGQVGARFFLYVTYALSKTALGDLNIPTESELSLVKLQPGEAVEIGAAIRMDGKIETSAWTVCYEIAPDVAKRFGTWGGKIETTTLTNHQMDELRFERAKKSAK